MISQSGEAVDGYKLSNINLEYESIEGSKISNETRQQYEMERQLWYQYTTLLKTEEWDKSSTLQTVDVNVPRKSLKAVVIFKDKTITDSEKYVNANIESVKVTIEGVPNSVFSQGLAKSNIYNEAKRFFGSKNSEDNLNKLDFLNDKYALVIDLRTVPERNVVNSGRKLQGTEAGLLLEIKKKATTNNMLAHIMVSDGNIVVAGRNLSRVEY